MTSTENEQISVGELLKDAPRNWGKWGPDDELGALNYLDAKEVLRGVQHIRSGDVFTVALPADPDPAAVPELVADLVALGVRVHAVEPARISLEDRLLGILRNGTSEEPS